jgi:hypothetical protein
VQPQHLTPHRQIKDTEHSSSKVAMGWCGRLAMFAAQRIKSQFMSHKLSREAQRMITMAPSWETFVDIECQSGQLHRATPTGYLLQLCMLPGQSNALDLPPTAAKLLAESEQSSWFVHLLMDFNHQAATSLSATAIETRHLLHLRQLQRGFFAVGVSRTNLRSVVS